MTDKPYPFTWTDISPEDRDERAKMWTGSHSVLVDMVKSDPLDILLPKAVASKAIGERIWKMKPRPDDIWMVTYPKSGSTLGQELMWQLATGCEVESEKTKEVVFLRVPFVEMTCLCGDVPAVPSLQGEAKNEVGLRTQAFMHDSVAFTENMEGPRVIKTHLPISMLPPDVLKVSKVLVFARNVKDACSSFYHHEQLLPNHGMDKNVTFDAYVEKYMKGQVAYGGYWTFMKVKKGCAQFRVLGKSRNLSICYSGLLEIQRREKLEDRLVRGHEEGPWQVYRGNQRFHWIQGAGGQAGRLSGPFGYQQIQKK